VHRSGPRGTVVLSVAAALLLAACSPVEGPAARPPDRAPVRVDESLGTVRVAPGSPVVVRVVLDAEDDAEALAAVLEEAFRAAVEDFGQVQQGFRVDLGTVVSTGCSEASGEQVGRELAASASADAVVAVLGPQCTSTLLGLQGHLSAAGLTVVVARPQELTLTEGPDGLIAKDHAEGVWRTSPSRLREAHAAAEHAFGTLELDRAATVHDGSIESSALAQAFKDRFESLGGTVVVAREVDARLVDEDAAVSGPALDVLLDAVEAGGVEVAFLPLAPGPLLVVADGLAGRSRLRSIVRMTTSGSATSEVLGEEVATGLLVTSAVLDFPDATSAVTGMSASQTFERVRSRSGVATPSGWWAYAYDAATLLLKAIEDASLIDVDGSFVLSRAELRQTIGMSTFGGMTGQVRCTPLGDCAAARIAVRRNEDAPGDRLADLPVDGIVEG
jgi:branched-chain amino acid transport system substrate-binding protein